MKKHLFNERDEWCAWLEEQHQTESEVWLIYYKGHTGKKSIRYREVLAEVLCFSWIDSKDKRIDTEIFMQRYMPRKV